MAWGSLTRRPKIHLKRNFAHIFNINAGHRTFFCSTILWITLPSHGDRWGQQNSGFFWSSPGQSKDEPTRDRPINRDPTNGDRSLQLFLLHILPLCNVWQHLNTCAFRVMQVYASHAIAVNKSRPKILAHVSLNANCFMFTSGCLLLFTFSYTFMAQKFYFTILQWTQETLFMHCANMSYIQETMI